MPTPGINISWDFNCSVRNRPAVPLHFLLREEPSVTRGSRWSKFLEKGTVGSVVELEHAPIFLLFLLGLRLWDAITARDWHLGTPTEPSIKKSMCGGVTRPVDTTRILGRCACKRVPAYHQLTHTEPSRPPKLKLWCGKQRITSANAESDDKK